MPSGDERSAGRPKATLFCPACGHEDRPDGDWEVQRDQSAALRYVHCPACGTRLTVRPDRSGSALPPTTVTAHCSRSASADD